MAEYFRPQEMNDLKDAFAMFDKDELGKISVKQIGDVMKVLGQNPTEAELQDIMNEVAPEGTGMIDLSIFVEIMGRKMKDMDKEDDIRAAFRVFDKDCRGFILPAELKFVISNLKPKRLTDMEMNELVKTADKNGDGQIDYDEFVTIMTTQK